MGIFEVTNTQYCAYLNAALASGDIELKSGDVYGKRGAWTGQLYFDIGYSHDDINKCWITKNENMFSVVFGRENWPVVAVTWYGSKAFAMYYGFDLPTEAEWEYSCRGGLQYKHGTDDGSISRMKANYNSNLGYPKDVGSFPKNSYGLFDMSGNVWEWCHDWYGSYTPASQNNPAGVQLSTYRVFRGGSWDSNDFNCRSAIRGGIAPSYRNYSIGFRVVKRLFPQNY